MNKPRIKVVAAIIENYAGEILCALRSSAMSNPLVWEFPGGKVTEGEAPEDALVREISEELKCQIQTGSLLTNTYHEYEKVVVNLMCYRCVLVGGIPEPVEHASLLWLKPGCLHSLVWAPADLPAVNKLVESSRL